VVGGEEAVEGAVAEDVEAAAGGEVGEDSATLSRRESAREAILADFRTRLATASGPPTRYRSLGESLPRTHAGD